MTNKNIYIIYLYMKKIGKRIKIKREIKKINLTELSKKVGVTVSCLSQIEKGKAFPSIITLKNIANELDTTVGELIGENERLLHNPIMHKEERKIVNVNKNGTELHLMSHHDESKKMETFFIVLKKDGDTADIMKKHSGEEFCYIINGEVELILEDINYKLKKGDCAYYNSNLNHIIKNTNRDISRILWVVTPPNI